MSMESVTIKVYSFLLLYFDDQMTSINTFYTIVMIDNCQAQFIINDLLVHMFL
jgi:hypothetical protein